MFKPQLSDLQEMAAGSIESHNEFRNAEIVILGARGFIGRWLCVSLAHLNREVGLNLKITGIVRQESRETVLTDNCYRELTFDSWENSKSKETLVTHVFHCATNTNKVDGNQKIDTERIIALTKKTLEKISNSNFAPVFVHLSSGAVYGDSARLKTRIDLKTPVEKLSRLNAYGQMKLTLEEIVKEANSKGIIRGSNPRLFSFAGPGLSLNSGFALPTFIGAARKGNPVVIDGNPDTVRSYLYPTDLVVRLFKAATSPSIEDAQIGARENVSMLQIANEVGKIWEVSVKVENRLNSQPNYYCPDESYTNPEIDLGKILHRWKSWLEIEETNTY